MKKTAHLILLILLFVFVLTSITCESKRDSVETQVDNIFARWDKPDSPGCALAVVKDGEIIYSRGYGMANLELGIPITPKTVFYIGSESKQFVTMCILLLAEEGKLSPDDDIRKYVPEIPEYDRPITIRHLIYHTSGLRDYFGLWSLAGIDFANFIPEAEVIDLLSRQKELNFTPGEKRLYSNSGYFLLSVIIKRVSGKSLREFADENIFKPLGMFNSHFHDDNTMLIKNRADGHFPLEDDGWGLQTFRFALVGSGGLYTNVEDLYLWDQNFYNNKLGRGGRKLIDLMLTRGKLNSGEEFDYTFALTPGVYRGLRTVRHGGALGGYRSHVLRFPEQKFTVILLYNLSNVDPGRFVEKVADLYLADQLAPVESEPETAENAASAKETAQKIELATAQLIEYAGDYYSGELDVTYKLLIEDGGLFVRIKYDSPVRMECLQKDVFAGPVGETVFKRDSRGKITGFTLDAWSAKNLKFVRK